MYVYVCLQKHGMQSYYRYNHELYMCESDSEICYADLPLIISRGNNSFILISSRTIDAKSSSNLKCILQLNTVQTTANLQ